MGDEVCPGVYQDVDMGEDGLMMDEEGDKEDDKEREEEIIMDDSSALYGSHGPKFGGGCDLLYSQFELNSPVAKVNQIILLEVCSQWLYIELWGCRNIWGEGGGGKAETLHF